MRLLSLFALAALCTSVSAQLSGGYTINPGAPTGGTNFKTFTDLGAALGAQGVSGPVSVRVTPGTYTESFQLPAAQGASATNTITIQSLIPLPGKVKLRGAASHTLELTGSTSSSTPSAAHYVFDNLIFESAPSGHAIYSNAYVDEVEIRNCRFEAAHNRYLLYITKRAQHWNIHHNEIVAVAGGYGLYMQQIYNSEVHHNQLDLNDCSRGMFFINYNDAQNKVYNNLFYGKLRDNGDALNMGASNYNNYVHNNTFVVQAQGAGAAAIYSQGHAGRTNKFYDNIIVVLGGGIGIEQYSASAALSGFVSDGNLFFCPGGAVGKDLNNVRHSNLASWRTATSQDAKSIEGNPGLVSAGPPYDLHIQPGSLAIDAASYFPAWITDDHYGKARGKKPDIGADELVTRPYGQSCPGTGSVAPEHGWTGDWKLGTTNFAGTIAKAQPNTVTVLFFGLSDTMWGSVPLPLPLPGNCSALTSMELAFAALADAQGVASYPLTVPNDKTFAGWTFYTQILAVDAGAVLGFTLTGGLALDT